MLSQKIIIIIMIALRASVSLQLKIPSIQFNISITIINKKTHKNKFNSGCTNKNHDNFTYITTTFLYRFNFIYKL